MDEINKKNTPNQMRILMKRIREGKYIANESQNTPKKDLNIRDMLKITRRLNEEMENTQRGRNVETIFDQRHEEEKMRNFFKTHMERNGGNPVNIKFINIEEYDNMVFWGGIVDGIIKFAYTVIPDKIGSEATYDYSEDFSPDDPNNDIIIDGLDQYFEIFREYCITNIFKQ